ncbi:MAG: rRNA maturation RNase YbeY [Nitrospinae bacterium]|nr:rRNA maturation RNase YbeY [Nitrospinota bacterium]MBL7020755.1 rRNA maturation RNase YbeY [Nitrospinaceae bacterium]
MEILIKNECPEIKVDARKIQQQIGKVLGSLDCNEHEISILFVGDQDIRDLNHRFRGIDRSTDVLSFPQLLEGEPEMPGAPVLGDVAISLETARDQSEEHGLSLEEELTLLLIHGILHLLGYDHEISDQEEVRMRKKTRELFTMIYPGKMLADTCNF